MLARLKKIALVYPLSALGTLAAAAGIGLLVVFFQTNNPLSLIFSAGFILAVLAAVIMGRVYAERTRRAVLEWDSSPPLVADTLETNQFVNLEGLSLFPFFNLHFRLTGRLKVGRDACIHVREEHPLIKRRDNRMPVSFYFPLSGVLSARGRFLFRDILGLTRTHFGGEENRELAVLPPGVSSLKLKEIVTNQGFEDSVKKRSQDEERYFMREYMPGDRLRDINWKASTRLNQLITKIAPVTQEQTKSIVVFFRNIKAEAGEGLESIVHLNRLKSLLLSFLRRVKQAAREYVFHVVGASESFVLETEEDIERFGIRLCAWVYERSPAATEYDRSTGEIFVFSTQFDEGLPGFLSLFTHARVTAVQTVSVSRDKRSAHSLFRLFVPYRPSLLPGRFIFKREKRVRPAPAGQFKNVVYERDPIEIRLW